MSQSDIEVGSFKSAQEQSAALELVRLFEDCPVPREQVLANLGLFLSSKDLSRILFMQHLYEQIYCVPGVVMEFGARWGQNLAIFSALRGIYDPFNRHRKIVGFDTFDGFPSISSKDGSAELMQVGKRSVTAKYSDYLGRILKLHEELNPLSHIEKFELVKGDAVETLPRYLDENPETIVALAFFDFDLYEPTKKCLELIRSRLVKGSVLGFDELNDHDAPGETMALIETFGLNNVALMRFPYASRVSYFVVE
jgi:hypothetical protein